VRSSRRSNVTALKRHLVVAALAGCAGFCLASATAFAYAKLNVWRNRGESFQLGYIVGYLDAVSLAKRHDVRGFVPAQSRPRYDYWRQLVNEYFENPANAHRSVPDAMRAVGTRIQEEEIKHWQDQRWKKLQKQLDAQPSPGAQVPAPGAAASAPDETSDSERATVRVDTPPANASPDARARP
jgi:hypothetical protein